MYLSREMRRKLFLFIVVALTAIGVMAVQFMELPATLFGVGRYTVRMELSETGGLYGSGNVTYRGVTVGRVQSVELTDTGVEAVLALQSGIDIPSDLKAEVHSQSAIGEQYVELLPRSDTAPPLRNGDVISLDDTSVPPDINTVLDGLVGGLRAVPHDNVSTVIDESYIAVGGLGAELSKIVRGGSKLASDARKNLDPLIALIDESKTVLDSQTETSDAIAGWAAHLATVTAELRDHDVAVAGIIDQGGPALGEVRQLIERVQPTLPILLANLASVSNVALTYQHSIEQILVLAPQLIAVEAGAIIAQVNTKQDYRGIYLSFNLNLNLPPSCTTGYLPAQQQRSPSFEDYPELPPGDLYCRVPQDSPLAVRGARNLPCATVPGKRAPTVKMCESDEAYVPLNDGFNWKGDPNATITGQDIPQLPPEASPEAGLSDPPPPIAVVEYDPATGSYIGPDGRQYTQSDLAETAPKDLTWEAMLLPPGS